MPVPSTEEAVRFLDRLCTVAERHGYVQSMSAWIRFSSGQDSRAARRYVALKTIREGITALDLPKNIFTAYYPGSTEDLYLDACLDVISPLLGGSARIEAVRLLNAQELVVGGLALQVANDEKASEATVAARQLKSDLIKRQAQIQKGLAALRASIPNSMGLPRLEGRWGAGKQDRDSIEPFTGKEWKAVRDESRGPATVAARATRAIYMRLVKAKCSYLLMTLMALPNGVDIVDAFGRNLDDGRRAAGTSLQSCTEAILELRSALIGDPSEVWKYSPALAMGAQAFAKSIGRPTTAPNLARVAMALAPHETGRINSVFGVLNAAVLLLLACGPIGAIVADVLAVALAVAESAVAVVREVEQDQAAIATTFADDGHKLSAGGKVGVAALKGVLAIGAAVAPVALGRIVGRAVAAGRAAEEVGTAFRESTAAGKDTGTAVRMTDNPQVSETLAKGMDKASASHMSSERAVSNTALTRQHERFGSEGRNLDLDREPNWESIPKRKFTEQEIKTATAELTPETLSQLTQAERRATVAKDLGPLFHDMVGTERQKATCERVLGRMLSVRTSPGEYEAALRAAGKMERAEVVSAASANADALIKRLKLHWDGVVSPRGTPSEAVGRVYAEAVRDSKTLAQVNEKVRDRLFSSWRGMFFTSIRGDPQLVFDLREQAGILLSPSGTNFTIELHRTLENGTVVAVEEFAFNIDHAGIRLSDAVIDALKTGDSQKLLSTISSGNLAFLLERENTRSVEIIRRDNAWMWNYRDDMEKTWAVLDALRDVPRGVASRGTAKPPAPVTVRRQPAAGASALPQAIPPRQRNDKDREEAETSTIGSLSVTARCTSSRARRK